MIITKPTQVNSLLFGVLVVLVAESHSLIPQQLATRSDCKATEVEFSLLVNQLAVLRLLNESSTSSSLDEGELQEIQELMNDLQEFKTTTMKEIQNMTAMINNMNEKNEETRQAVNEVKEAVSDLLRQASIMTTTPPLDCEDSWIKYQSSCYKVFKRSAPYAAAMANCKAHDAHLAIISSEGENSFVHGMIESLTYIGLSDKDQEGVFTWQDGSAFSYSKWQSGQPNSAGGNQDCVAMERDSYWGDTTCEDSWDYVCEKRLQ